MPVGLGACDHQVVNFFHLVVVLASVKQLRKCPSDTIIWVLQRGAPAEGVGEGSVPGRPPRVLLHYSFCLVDAFRGYKEKKKKVEPGKVL